MNDIFKKYIRIIDLKFVRQVSYKINYINTLYNGNYIIIKQKKNKNNENYSKKTKNYLIYFIFYLMFI